MAYRAVLAGCGRMARGWIEALRDAPTLKGRVQLVGLVDVDANAAEALSDRFGLTAATGSNLEEMLAATKPDLLFDVAVPDARRELVLAGFKHGCHVLTEKPMATSLEDARAMVAAGKAANRTYAVLQNRRFNEGIRRIKATIESDVLGELTGLHCEFFVGAHFGGFREQMEHILLVDMAIHTLDAARFMAGTDPIAVYCHEHNPRGSWYMHGAAAEAIFEFGNDVVFTYSGSWVAEGARTSWDSSWRIVGTKGTLLWDGAFGFSAEVVVPSEGLLKQVTPAPVALPQDPAQTLGHASVLTEFLDAIDAGREPETAGSDNIKSLAMVFGAIESARLKQRILITP